MTLGDCMGTMCQPLQSWQVVVIGVALIELVVFLSVFVTPSTFDGKKTISENMFEYPYFKGGLSVLVFLQLLACVIYIRVYRLVEIKLVRLGYLGVFTSALGWILVVTNDPESQTTAHSAGAGVFIMGGAVVYFIMVELASSHDPARVLPYDCVAGSFLVSALVFTIIYVGLYFSYPDAAWFWENLGFVICLCGHIVFFFFHPFDPFYPLQPDPTFPDATVRLMGFQI